MRTVLYRITLWFFSTINNIFTTIISLTTHTTMIMSTTTTILTKTIAWPHPRSKFLSELFFQM